MKKIIARLLSFFLDLMLVTLIVGGVAQLPTFDKYTNNIEYVRQEALKSNKNYEKLDSEIDDILKDALVNDEEFNYLHTNFIEYRTVFDDVKPNTNISKDFIDNIHENIKDTYMDIYSSQLFEIAHESRYQSIISIIIYLLYFGLVQYLLKGQTIFKRIFKIKVVNNKDINKRIPLWKFIIRALLVCDIIFTIADLIAISNLQLNNYLTFNTYLGNIRFFYEVIFIMFLMLRDDQRSVHDLILNTKVIRYDKDGKVQKDILFKIDETEQVSNKKVREEVKAIKVND